MAFPIGDQPSNQPLSVTRLADDVLAARHVLLHGGRLLATSVVAGTYPLHTAMWGAAMGRLDEGDYSIPPKAALLRVRCFLRTTGSQGFTFVFGLHPITGSSGGAGAVPALTVGAAVGSTVTLGPTPTPLATQISAAFSFPSAGNYVLCCVTSGTVVSPGVELGAQLLLEHQ
jgi:hypothetical protein